MIRGCAGPVANLIAACIGTTIEQDIGHHAASRKLQGSETGTR